MVLAIVAFCLMFWGWGFWPAMIVFWLVLVIVAYHQRCEEFCRAIEYMEKHD